LTERDGYEHGVPCWVDTWQEDPDTAVRFYTGVFGWQVEKGTPGRADTRYYMCRLRGRDVAAIGSPPPAGMSPAWTTYVWVDDADAVAASAANAGGNLLTGPFGSLDGGRMAIIADPSGAAFGVWTPGAHRVNEPSAYAMSFLRTPDPERAKVFYGAVLGRTTEAFGSMLLWRLPGYVGGVPEQPVARDVVAVMARAGDGEVAHWRADFWIANADAAAARATQLGGSILTGPEDAGPFREAVLADPAGATFSVSQLTGSWRPAGALLGLVHRGLRLPSHPPEAIRQGTAARVRRHSCFYEHGAICRDSLGLPVLLVWASRPPVRQLGGWVSSAARLWSSPGSGRLQSGAG
jgi:predicted enzyme related to lactoylglutathione lyase